MALAACQGHGQPGGRAELDRNLRGNKTPETKSEFVWTAGSPLHLRNAPTDLMKALDYGKGYQYDHDWPEKISPQEALPDALPGRQFYQPGPFGFEKEIAKRLEYFERVKMKLRDDSSV